MSDSQKTNAVAEHVDLMLSLPGILNEDLSEARELFRFTTPDFATRTMVRTMSAEFEAHLFLLWEFLVKLHETGKESFKLSEEELHILRSESFSIKPNGTVSRSRRFFPFKERMLFVLKVSARVINPAASPDTNSQNWPSVEQFIGIRNRLTHPKRLEDLHITDAEIEHLNRAQDWIRDSLKALFNAGEFGEAARKLAEKHENGAT